MSGKVIFSSDSPNIHFSPRLAVSPVYETGPFSGFQIFSTKNSTLNALASAAAPSFSSRLRPAIKTFSLRGEPAALDCLWHSVKAEARTYKITVTYRLKIFNMSNTFLSLVTHVKSDYWHQSSNGWRVYYNSVDLSLNLPYPLQCPSHNY